MALAFGAQADAGGDALDRPARQLELVHGLCGHVDAGLPEHGELHALRAREAQLLQRREAVGSQGTRRFDVLSMARHP